MSFRDSFQLQYFRCQKFVDNYEKLQEQNNFQGVAENKCQELLAVTVTSSDWTTRQTVCDIKKVT